MREIIDAWIDRWMEGGDEARWVGLTHFFLAVCGIVSALMCVWLTQ